MVYADFSAAEGRYRLLIYGGAGSRKILARRESLDLVLEDVMRAAPENNSTNILPSAFYLDNPSPAHSPYHRPL